ncbi:UNVERIFIED_CONTAM: hypothetical protein FKN15_073307 [Acipenser sinensis]
MWNKYTGLYLCGFSNSDIKYIDTGVFLRWNRSSKCLDEAYEEMIHIIEHNKELQSKVNTLRRQLAELETEDVQLETP